MKQVNLLSVFVILTLTIYGVLIQQAQAQGYQNPRNPCHPNKRSLGEGSDCEVYRIPPRLCQKCRIKPENYDMSGKFDQCTSIYDIQNTQCKAELQRYAKWNKCDKLRNEQVANYDANLIPLDYFIYSVCEECCDCVTTGSKLEQFQSRKNAGTLFDVATRPNCGTHAAADICLVWPKVKTVVNWNGQRPSPEKLAKMPSLCQPLRKWRLDRQPKSGAGLSQFEIDNVPADAQTFLTNFIKVAKCGKKRVWQECVKLESSQKRI